MKRRCKLGLFLISIGLLISSTTSLSYNQSEPSVLDKFFFVSSAIIFAVGLVVGKKEEEGKDVSQSKS